jgi:hypothetical protein
MTYEPLNRRLAILAAVFAFLGVVLAVIALATNYWTISTTINQVHNGTTLVEVQTTGELWNVCILKFEKSNFFNNFFLI